MMFCATASPLAASHCTAAHPQYTIVPLLLSGTGILCCFSCTPRFRCGGEAYPFVFNQVRLGTTFRAGASIRDVRQGFHCRVRGGRAYRAEPLFCALDLYKYGATRLAFLRLGVFSVEPLPPATKLERLAMLAKADVPNTSVACKLRRISSIYLACGVRQCGQKRTQ